MFTKNGYSRPAARNLINQSINGNITEADVAYKLCVHVSKPASFANTSKEIYDYELNYSRCLNLFVSLFFLVRLKRKSKKICQTSA